MKKNTLYANNQLKNHIINSYKSFLNQNFKVIWFITILLFSQAALTFVCIDYAFAWPFQSAKTTKIKPSENLNKQQKLNQDGLKLFESGDYTNAADKFIQVLSITPENPEARYNLGVCYFLTERNDDAINEFSSVLKKNPDFIEAQQYLSQAYEKKIDYLSQRGSIAGAVKTAGEYSRQFYISGQEKERIEKLRSDLLAKKNEFDAHTPAADTGQAAVINGSSKKTAGNINGELSVQAGKNVSADEAAKARPDQAAASESDVLKTVRMIESADMNINSVVDFIKSLPDDGAGLIKIESALNNVLENNLKNYGAHIALGVLYKKKKLKERANYHFQTAMIIDPSDLKARTEMNDDSVKNDFVSSEIGEKSKITINNNAEKKANDSTSVEITADDINNSSAENDVPQTINSRLPNEIIVLKHKLESNSASIEDLKKIACYYINKKDYEKAQKALYFSFAVDSSDNETNYLISYLKLTQKKKEEALTFAFSINPDTTADAKLLHDTGVLLMRLKKDEHAVKFFQKGIESDQRYIENYISLAVYYSRINDFDTARKYFNDALNISPENMKVLYFKALSAKKEGNFEAFLDISKKMQAVSPENIYSKKIRRQMGISPGDQLLSYENEKTLIDTARSYIKLREYSKALIKAREAVKISPDNYEANEVLALSYKENGDYINYAAFLLKANELNYNDALTQKLGKVFFELELYSIGYDYYARYMSRHPGDTMLKIEVINYLKNAGVFVLARTICDTIITKAKTPMEIEAAKSILEELKMAETKECELNYLNEKGRENFVKLLKTLYGYEMYKPIEYIFEAYSGAGENAAEIAEIYAATLIKSKQYAKAIEAYKNMIARDRLNYFPYYQTGIVYMKRNNFKRAEEYFRQALIYKPDDSEILTNLGDSCLYQKNIEDAEVAYLEAYNNARSVLLKEEAKLKLDKVRIKLNQNF